MSERELPPRSGTYRLGVFGSMLDPVHRGHVALVEAAWRALDLDRVVVVPAGIPPHRDPPAADPRTRLAVAVRAFAGIDHVVVSDSEVERAEAGEVGYMADTLDELVREPAELGFDELVVEPTLVVGADQLIGLDRWHRWRDIVELARVGYVSRPGTPAGDLALARARLEQAGARLVAIEMEPVAASSTEARELAARGDRTRLAELVPRGVVDEVLAAWGPGR